MTASPLLLFVSIAWPAAAAVSLSIAVGGRDVTVLGLFLVANGTAAAYALDRFVDNRSSDSPRARRVLFVIIVATAIATALLACTAWWRFQICAILGFVSSAYVPLKQWIPKNIMTTLAWTAATATLPFAQRPQIDPSYLASVVSVALIMLANTILCDIPDVAMDRRLGVQGITPHYGPRVGALSAFFLGIVGSTSGFIWGHLGLAAAAFGLSVLAVLCYRNPQNQQHRKIADGLVTFLPGPIAPLIP